MATNGVEYNAVRSFDYPVCPDALAGPAWDGWVEVLDDSEYADPKGPPGSCNGARFEERLAEESRRAFETGRERGREEGRRAEREAVALATATEAERQRRQAADFLEQFSQERDRYLHAVEQEVVRLSLAVAGRILRREAQMDPLLLTGAVRVALGQLAATSEIRIRVPAKEADLWKETIDHLRNLTTKPQVVPEEDMRLGDCVIESAAGTVDLGIRAQLSEIERGFFDHLGSQHARGPEPTAGVHS